MLQFTHQHNCSPVLTSSMLFAAVRSQRLAVAGTPQPNPYISARQACVQRLKRIPRVPMAASSRDPVTVVQEQLEAYNARDLDRFMAVMAENVVSMDAVTGAVLAEGKEQLRPRYVERFKTAVHSELLGRLCLGDVVVDREIITGLPNNAEADCLATYTIKEGLIQKMAFVWQARGNTQWKP